MKLTPKKTKFRIKATKDEGSSCCSTKEMDLGIILIGTIPISLNCSTNSLTLLDFFKSKKMEKSLVEVKKKKAISNR